MPIPTALPSFTAILCFEEGNLSILEDNFFSTLSGTPVKKLIFLFRSFKSLSTFNHLFN